MRRAILLLTLMGAMLFACTGVVLAQTTTPAKSSNAPNAPTGSRPASAEDPIPNQYIVVLDDKEDAKQASKDAEKDHGEDQECLRERDQGLLRRAIGF